MPLPNDQSFCEFFQAIEADPMAKIKGLTIGDMLLARQHIQNCDDCNIRVERVLSRYDDREDIKENPGQYPEDMLN